MPGESNRVVGKNESIDSSSKAAAVHDIKEIELKPSSNNNKMNNSSQNEEDGKRIVAWWNDSKDRERYFGHIVYAYVLEKKGSQVSLSIINLSKNKRRKKTPEIVVVKQASFLEEAIQTFNMTL